MAEWEPQLATRVGAPPDDPGWGHELAREGVRVAAFVRDGDVRLVAEDGADRTDHFPEVVAALGALEVRGALLDGEIAGPTYFVSDLLRLGRRDLRRRPLADRKRELARVLEGADPRVRLSEHVEAPGAEVLRRACALGAPGIVSKRLDAPYEPGRGRTWLETRCGSSPGTAAATEAVRSSPARSRRASGGPVVAGVRISHPDRVVFPDEGLTKLDLARYYEAIGERMLPHVRGRPLTLLRCAGPIGEGCAFMKHSKVWAPEALRRIHIPEKTKLGEYLVADSVAALVSLAQMDVVEVHTWNSRAGDVERPDRIVLDLDPGPEVPWGRVVDGARTVRRVLAALGLEADVKTTGGAGLHVVVPIAPALDVSECLAFARALAAAVARQDPEGWTTSYAKRGRERKILLDYLRNNRTNTSVAAFSVRARPGAPVSVPIGWDELTDDLRSDAWDVRTAPDREDPWTSPPDQRIPTGAISALTALSR